MDWTDPTVSESTEEKEAEMSSLAAGFTTRMCKQGANAQVEATLGSKGPNGKCSRRSDQKNET